MGVIGKDGCTAEETTAVVYTWYRGGQNRVEEGVLAINQRHHSHTGHSGRALPRKVNVMTVVEAWPTPARLSGVRKNLFVLWWTEPLRKEVTLERKWGTTKRSQKYGVGRQQF